MRTIRENLNNLLTLDPNSGKR